ncbi:ArsR family transcriptional regulator [Cupriavidus necator]|uniref:ArsR family transcriptional regulator n=1 Tax=Cupriavidus necator TaxID=106590 RepID=UPI0039C136A3
METQESALTLALMTVPARATICRALLEAGEDGLPAADLARLAGLSLPRAAHVFQELMQAEVVALAIRERQVCYVLKARRAVRDALGYIDGSGLAD